MPGTLRALDAVDQFTDERLGQVQENLRVRALLPSLHLNLADDYRRLTRQEPALEQLRLVATGRTCP